MVTGILARKREFALLRSVGMSQKQFSVLVHCEGLFIVFAGLLLSIAVGCGTGYILCGFYGNGIKTAKQVVHDGRTEIVIFCLDRKSCL
ncbi:ABC transporter permease [Eisenbergiella porci]|uniref:ABC transporter permease n=1 Tax=Eisenbergiella porci TaxID=2652274 RepID=UPI002A7F4033|nr:ABC transporter permease [Eisenbergiella porci]